MMDKKMIPLCTLLFLLLSACGGETPDTEAQAQSAQTQVQAEEEDTALGIPGSHYVSVIDAMSGVYGFDAAAQEDYYQYQRISSSEQPSGVEGISLSYTMLFYGEDDTVAEVLCTVSGPDAGEEA